MDQLANRQQALPATSFPSLKAMTNKVKEKEKKKKKKKKRSRYT